jgi:sugar phosphate isomerase/epimerase
MYPAVFAKTYPGSDAAAVLDSAARDGFAGVQFNLVCAGIPSLPESLPDGLAEDVGAYAKKTELRIAALSGTYNMAHPDPAARMLSRQGFLNAMEAARRMGAPVVTLCTGSRDASDMWKHHAENSTAAAWRDLCEELEFALGAAESAGLKLAIEPEPGNVICDASAARRLLRELNSLRLGIVLDAANLLSAASLARQDRVIEEATDLLGGHVLLAHAKDIDASGRVVPAGEGEVHLKRFVAALRSADFDGALIGHGFGPDKARAVARRLTELVETAA